MADPEQIYAEVLQEEQQKGSGGQVAEGRAKAARARVEAGSPHPKEAKWWPGAQPHLENGGQAAAEDGEAAAEPAEEAEEAERPAAEAPAEAEPAEPEPAEPEPEPAPAAQPAAAAPAAEAAPAPAAQPAPAAEQPAAQAQPAAAAVATEAPPSGRSEAGVTHGTPSGNRLRPEDSVSTDAQFAGQQAMYERRKLIDELVATGVPAVAASNSGRPRAPWLAVLYLLIPVMVIAFLVANGSNEAAAPAEGPTSSGSGSSGGAASDVIVAQDLAFDADTIDVKAKKPTDFTLDNQDTAIHNLVIFPTEEDATDPSTALFTSPDADPGASEEFTIDPLDKGDYYFHCQFHPTMNGTVSSG